MKRAADRQEPVRKLVLYFDLCSSMSILDELIRARRQREWGRMLVKLHGFLRNRKRLEGFEIYKFVGDGWILLFEPDYSLARLLRLLRQICKAYERLHQRHIDPHLAAPVDKVGAMFGLDLGLVIRVVMNRQVEYFGEPLNVATRLQETLTDQEAAPQWKVLMSSAVFERLDSRTQKNYRIDTRHSEPLRHVAGGRKFRAETLWL